MTRAELEQRIEEILVGVEPGEVRVSHPDGRSVIMSTYQQAALEIMQAVDKYTAAPNKLKALETK